MNEQEQSLRPIEKLCIQRKDAMKKLQSGSREEFGEYLTDLTMELNQEMRLITGRGAGAVEAAWLIEDSTATLAAFYLADIKTALGQEVVPVWLDLAAVNFMIGFGYTGFKILWDGYLELKKEANKKGIRGIDTMKFLSIAT
jgi:hypothetical protein